MNTGYFMCDLELFGHIAISVYLMAYSISTYIHAAVKPVYNKFCKTC